LSPIGWPIKVFERPYPLEEAIMFRRTIISTMAGLMLASLSAHAQLTDDVVKIGVLTDMAGVTADITGKGSVVAAQLAVEEFGSTILGKPI
jgi:branched-chain amino acid transport system substrate-binding protein